MPEELQLRQIDEDELLTLVSLASIQAQSAILSNHQATMKITDLAYEHAKPVPDVIASMAVDHAEALARALLKRTAR